MNNINEFLKPIDFVIVIGYLIILIGIGYWVSFIKKKKNNDNLFLAGHSLNWSKIGLTMWGTNVGPSMLIASCSIGYTTGIVAGNFSWLAFVFIFLLAFVFAPKYLGAKVTTLPEFMGKRFGESTRSILAWYTTVTVLVSWLSLTLYAGGILVGQILDIPLFWSVIILVSISAFFTIAGGLEAIAYTNVFQMILLIVVSLGLTVMGLHNAGGAVSVFENTPGEYWNLFLPSDDPKYPWIALVLGYPVLAVWFWCTDQSMVQSVLGAKNLRQGQLGANLTGWLKILDLPLFILPGVICFVLFPNLGNPDEAYMTMVTRLFPAGMTGLVMAVLIAALISTIDSALNSLSTVFTMDIYLKRYKPNASQKEIIKTGRLVTLLGSVLSIFLTLSIDSVKGLNLFDLFQAILGFLAPPMTAVFLSGVLWKKTSTKAVNIALSAGSAFSFTIGVLYLWVFPATTYDFWPHFLLLSFFIFVVIQIQIRLVSLFDSKSALKRSDLFHLQSASKVSKDVKIIWGALILLMVFLYIFFNGHETKTEPEMLNALEENRKKEWVIELVVDTGREDYTEHIHSLLHARQIDTTNLLKWKNRYAIINLQDTLKEMLVNELQEDKIGEVSVYEDIIYRFRRSDCNEVSEKLKLKQYLLTVNLVDDAHKQKEYLEHHSTQAANWPEVVKGFCQEGFQKIDIYKKGRQLMLLISIPQNMDLEQMSRDNARNNPGVAEWDELMSTYQEGISGTRPGEKWVMFK